MKNIARLLLVSALLLTDRSSAEQSGAGHYVSGQTADFSGTVPTEPGWIFGNYFLNYNDARFGAAKGLPLGGVIALNVTVNQSAEVPLAIYAYPFDFLGGTLASGVCVPYVWVRVKANGTIDRNGVPHAVSKTQSASGLGDIELMPVMAGWTNGDFKVDAMFNVWAPTGEYHQGNLANQGLGYWTFEPMIALSWLSSKIGTEASVFTAVDFNSKNTDADYQSGNIFHVDATLAQHLPLFGGIAGAGATAFWVRQISNDTGSGAKLGGFMVNSYGVGPTLSYVHKIKESDLIIDASWLPQSHTVNTVKGTFIWVKATLVF